MSRAWIVSVAAAAVLLAGCSAPQQEEAQVQPPPPAVEQGEPSPAEVACDELLTVSGDIAEPWGDAVAAVAVGDAPDDATLDALYDAGATFSQVGASGQIGDGGQAARAAGDLLQEWVAAVDRGDQPDYLIELSDDITRNLTTAQAACVEVVSGS